MMGVRGSPSVLYFPRNLAQLVHPPRHEQHLAVGRTDLQRGCPSDSRRRGGDEHDPATDHRSSDGATTGIRRPVPRPRSSGSRPPSAGWTRAARSETGHTEVLSALADAAGVPLESLDVARFNFGAGDDDRMTMGASPTASDRVDPEPIAAALDVD